MIDPYTLVGPCLRALPPEAAHRAALFVLEHGLVPARPVPDDLALAVRLWGMTFPNPIGLAAGFDKEAVVCDAMLRLGFGLVEAGTVTPKPQPGNAGPRLHRLARDRAVINRLGFNSGGLESFVGRLAARRAAGRPGIVGANVGRNAVTDDAIADFVTGIAATAPVADYLVVNISSPNTQGLRDLQRRASLDALLKAVTTARDRAVSGRTPPLLVKIAPDLDAAAREDVAAVAIARGVDGLIVCNTTVERPAGLRDRHKDRAGGLSGRPLFPIALAAVADFRRLTEGAIPIVGAGGVASGADAYRMIRAGASLVQLYSALVYEGPGLAVRIKRDLAQRLRADGFRSVAEAVGVDVSMTIHQGFRSVNTLSRP